MLVFFSFWLLLKLSSADFVANFSGHSLLAFYPSNETKDFTLDLSFHTAFSYGLVFSVFNSLDMLFRVQLRNKTLTLDISELGGAVSTKDLCDCYDTSDWNSITVIRTVDSLNISVKETSYQYQLHDDTGPIENVIYFGGLSSFIDIPYHQFSGLMRNIKVSGTNILGTDPLTDNISVKNIETISEDVDVKPVHGDYPQTVTVNNSDIRFPVTYTTFTNFSLSFEFKSPENVLQFLSFQMRQYYFLLRKDYKQLILESNLHGEHSKLAVELTSVKQWVSVGLKVSDQITLLSSGDRNNEVESKTPITNTRLNKRPLYFGSNPEAASAGFRGCVSNFVLDGEPFPLSEHALSQAGTLVGCWYPSEGCDDLSCPYSCLQTWDETKCTTVGTTLKTAEFDGFGIIEINMPSLIDPQDEELRVSFQFVSTSSKDDVLLSLQHSQQDMASFLIIQMVEGYLSLSLTDNVQLNTDSPLDDGQSHEVTVTVSPSEVFFRVDTKKWGRTTTVDMGSFRQPTSIKIGGISLKVNDYKFSGCLSEVSINSVELLTLTATQSQNIVIQSGVQLLGHCPLLKENTVIPVDSVTRPFQTSAPPTTHYSGEGRTKDEYDDDRPTLLPPNEQHVVDNNPHLDRTDRKDKKDEQLLIGLMLGFVTLLAIVIFLAYFLWQRRQMHQTEKRRARKASEDETLDEEFLNKTYNPKKQDKYTLFTPHALDSIEEESTSMLSLNVATL